jgi:hypothetical protein
MIVEGSGQSAELNSYQCQIDEGFGGFGGLFIVPRQPQVPHQPPKRSLHHPPTRQHAKSTGRVAALDHFDAEVRPHHPHPARKHLPAIASVYPDSPQPAEPAQGTPQQPLRIEFASLQNFAFVTSSFGGQVTPAGRGRRGGGIGRCLRRWLRRAARGTWCRRSGGHRGDWSYSQPQSGFLACAGG